jgi:hypothetical protein
MPESAGGYNRIGTFAEPAGIETAAQAGQQAICSAAPERLEAEMRG